MFRLLKKDLSEEFDITDEKYIQIAGALRAQRNRRETKIVEHNRAGGGPLPRSISDTVLALHIPGTSQRATFDELPTYQALVNAQKQDPEHVAFHSFEGVGSEGEGYVSPAFQDTTSLTPKKATNRSGSQIVKSAFTGRSGKAPENQFVFGDTTARLFGLLAGAGKSQNVILAINLLRQLKKDNLLPKSILLSGFSRGAVACVALANAIYAEFGNQIKIHLCLIDPVPGPQTIERPEEHVIPPTVETFTTVYSRDYHYVGFKALDLNELIFSNPNTVVTTFSIPETTHSDVYEKNKAVQETIQAVTYAALGISRQFDIVEQETYPINEMVGMSGNRKGSRYGKMTGIHPNCSDKISTTLHLVRKTFFAGYNEQSVPPVHNVEVFNIQEHQTSEERQKFIIGQHIKLRTQNSDEVEIDISPQVAKEYLEKIRDLILKLSTRKEIPGKTTIGVEFVKSESPLKVERRFVSESDYEILMRIKAAKDAAHYDITSIEYLKAWAELSQNTYGQAIIAQEKQKKLISLPQENPSSTSSSSTTIEPEKAMLRLKEINKYIFKLSSPVAFADYLPFGFVGFGLHGTVTKFVKPDDIWIVRLISTARVESQGDPESQIWADTWRQVEHTEYAKVVVGQEWDHIARERQKESREVAPGEAPNPSEPSQSSTSTGGLGSRSSRN